MRRLVPREGRARSTILHTYFGKARLSAGCWGFSSFAMPSV